MIRDGWTHHGGVRLHYLTNDGSDEEALPVVIVPGFGESADEYRWLVDELSPRWVVAVSVRARGQSDAPADGYAWEDHVGDVEAVVEASGLTRFAVVAFSRGVSYALGWAFRHPEAVAGLVIGDYYARHVGLPPTFMEYSRRTVVRGTPMIERMAQHAIEGVQRQSVEIPLWDRLAELRGPVLVVRGGRSSALVDDEIASQYRRFLPSVQFAMLPAAGHDLWGRDPAAFVKVVKPFLDQL